MGYTTSFLGSIEIDPPLNDDEIYYLNKFSDSRRMKREKGEYYVDNAGPFGQDKEPDIIDYNNPPDNQPGLWCQWVPNEDGSALVWNGAEKFYHSREWMEYIISHFLMPNAFAKSEILTPEISKLFDNFTFDHVLNGEIIAQGEEVSDRWKLVVRDNIVSVIGLE